MKKKFSIVFSALTFITLSNTSFANCPTEPLEIEKIHVGEVHLRYGHDGGNAVYVKLKNWNNRYEPSGSIPLNDERNLNDAMGSSILATLRTAFALRLKVKLTDHHGGQCDDFDEVEVFRD